MKKIQIEISYSKGVKNVGKQSKTLVSALIGASSIKSLSEQFKKIEAIENMSTNYKPDIISDLSIVKPISTIPLYQHILLNYPNFIVSTLPIYLCSFSQGLIDDNELIDVINKQVESGVSILTIHPTPTKSIINKAQKRLVPWTSRGGGMIIKDLVKREFRTENAYIRIIDEIVKIAIKKNVVISVGASFRSANIFDSLDLAQIEEFEMQESIAKYLYQRGIGVIIEGPGHCPPQKLSKVAQRYSEMGFPIMPLGPIPTDTAIGNDHISSAIGATLLGVYNCVDIIAAVTREEHTGKVPNINSTIEAIIASKIAAHVIDIFKINDISSDFEVANYRATNNTCIYGKKTSGCDRCSHLCPLK